MKKTIFAAVFTVFACAAFAETSNVALPHVAIPGFANRTGDPSFDTPSTTATDSLALTIRLLGSYEIVSSESTPPTTTDKDLLVWCETESVDYVLYGSITAPKGGAQAYDLAVFDRAKGKTTIRKSARGASIFDVFSCADTLTFAVIDAIAGRHVGFGSIAFEVANPENSEGKAIISLDGTKITEGFGQIDRVVEGNHLVSVKWEAAGAKPEEIALVEAAVAEGESATVSVVIPGSKSSEAKRTPRTDRSRAGLQGDKMVLVEGGTFIMGSDTGPANERPAHEVTVASLYMAKTEVTQEEFEKLLGYLPKGLGMLKFAQKKIGSQYPVLLLNRFDAVEYCKKLSIREGYQPAYTVRKGKVTWDRLADGYRLPTEAEWEYAAKGGANHDAFLYPGSDDVTEVAIISKTANGNGYATIASKKPNSLGIFDMGGNAYEWCWDQFKSYNGFNYGNHVIRGGDSLHGIKEARCTARAGEWEGWNIKEWDGNPSRNIGFRVVRSVMESEE